VISLIGRDRRVKRRELVREIEREGDSERERNKEREKRRLWMKEIESTTKKQRYKE